MKKHKPKNTKQTDPHKQSAQEFLFALFKGSLEQFWNSLADVDQMGLYAEYNNILNSNMNDYAGFLDYLESIRYEQRVIYLRYQNNCEVTNSGKIAPDGEVHFISPTDVEGVDMPIRLVFNTKYSTKSGYTVHWKARITKNDFREALDS